MEEIWKDIKGYEKLYQVSNLGNIKSLTRQIRCANGGYRTIQGKIIKQFIMNSGYYMVRLWVNNTSKSFLVHRLVAETFIPNLNNLPEVNHKDGNKLNNCIDNLEWVTTSENVIHAYKNGLIQNQAQALADSNKKLKSKKVIQYDLQGNYITEYPSISFICKKFNYSQGAIANVCRGERNKAYNYIWKYEQ